jgi:cytochrome c553
MRTLRAMAGMLAGLVLVAGAARAQDAPADTVRRATHVCAACHGEGGRSPTQAIPSLAGQMRQYTIAQLKDFRGQIRAETSSRAYMWGVSALLDDATIEGLADYYAAQAPARGHPGNPALLRLGRKIFSEGIPARGVRPCASCHGGGDEGAAGFPRLAGQHADYVTAQLKVFRTWLRPHAVLMKQETQAMSLGEMRAVAVYVQSL